MYNLPKLDYIILLNKLNTHDKFMSHFFANKDGNAIDANRIELQGINFKV